MRMIQLFSAALGVAVYNAPGLTVLTFKKIQLESTDDEIAPFDKTLGQPFVQYHPAAVGRRHQSALGACCRRGPEETGFDTISVTATRIERANREVPSAVNVIDSDQIEGSRMMNIKDAIQGTPGC